MINIETVKFIGMLNDLAERTIFDRRKFPFSKKDAEIVKICKKDPSCWDLYIFYDDKRLELEDEGIKYYPVIQTMQVDDEHNDIISYFENVYVCIPNDESEESYLVVYPDTEEDDDTVIIIENGNWYTA